MDNEFCTNPAVPLGCGTALSNSSKRLSTVARSLGRVGLGATGGGTFTPPPPPTLTLMLLLLLLLLVLLLALTPFTKPPLPPLSLATGEERRINCH